MTSTTLQQYLNAAWAENKIDHVVRAVSIESGDGPGTEFYIRPQLGDGETLQLVVVGNRIVLPVRADKTLMDDFAHFLSYSNLSPSAELLIAYADGRGQAITLMDAIIAVDPLLSATHKALEAHQQEQVLEGAPIATITAPPLDGRKIEGFPDVHPPSDADLSGQGHPISPELLGALAGRAPATGRSAELRATDEYVPPSNGLGYELHIPSESPRQLTSHLVNPCNDTLTITVADKRAPDGGNRLYVIGGVPHRDLGAMAEKVELLLGTHEPLIAIPFQDGPINEVGVNGLTHEVLLAILIDRLEGFQDGPYANDFNGNALHHLREAQEQLLDRTRERMARGVEGTHTK